MDQRTTTSGTTEKTPSEILAEQKMTYGELVRAKIAARSNRATVQDKIAVIRLKQRRDARALALRKTFKVVSG